MKIIDINITNAIQSILPIKGFIYNPSLMHINDNVYLLSIRLTRNKKLDQMVYNPDLYENKQHPWSDGWSSFQIDQTYLCLIKINYDNVIIVPHKMYPIIIDNAQDTRLFSFYNDEKNVSSIIYYQHSVSDPNKIIKNGISCEKKCFEIKWFYTVINKKTFDISMSPADDTLCFNISERIEKNWSLFSINKDDKVKLYCLYSLLDYNKEQKIFEIKINDIINNKVIGGDKCKLELIIDKKYNFFYNLSKYYDEQLFISGGSPIYQINENEYQGIGHIKIRKDYIINSDKKQLRHLKNIKNNKYSHNTYVYFIFLFRIKIDKNKFVDLATDDTVSSVQNTNQQVEMMNINFTKISDAFLINSGSLHYFLSFPSGYEIHDNDVYITYGYGDYEAHMLKMSKNVTDKMMRTFKTLNPSEFKFLVYDISYDIVNIIDV